MFILICPECYSEKLKRYEGKMTDLGHDWFSCQECCHNFTLKKASYKKY